MLIVKKRMKKQRELKKMGYLSGKLLENLQKKPKKYREIGTKVKRCKRRLKSVAKIVRQRIKPFGRRGKQIRRTA